MNKAWATHLVGLELDEIIDLKRVDLASQIGFDLAQDIMAGVIQKAIFSTH